MRRRFTIGRVSISAAISAPALPISSWTDPFTGAHNTFNKTGFIGGGQVGANWQINTLVLGIEGDFDWTGLKGSGHDLVGNTINTNTQWTSTVTGRAGVAFDRLLIYGKGGVAFAHDNDSLNDIFGSTASASATRTGWTAGAGLEYAFAPNWSAKIEYRLSRLRLRDAQSAYRRIFHVQLQRVAERSRSQSRHQFQVWAVTQVNSEW